MTTRETEVEAETIDAYDACCEVLEDATTQGAFRVLVDEPAQQYSIGWATRLTGSRYDFRFEPQGRTRCRVQVDLTFEGWFGPLLNVLRARGNDAHLERILSDIRKLAESEEFYNDDEDDADEDWQAEDAEPAR